MDGIDVMNNKMVRFLNSIGISDVESFDLDFDLVSRNTFNKQQIDMIIVKDSPWTYELLERFQNGLNTIKYPYTLSFSYNKKPNVNDAISLFYDWHRAINRFNAETKLEGKGKSIKFIYLDESEIDENKQVRKDFGDFLKFLNYSFVIDTDIVKNEIIIDNCEDSLVQNKDETSDENIINEIDDDESLSSLEEQCIDNLKSNIENLKKTKSQKSFSYSSGDEKWRNDVFYKPIKDLSKITSESGNVDVSGELYGVDKTKMTRQGKTYLVAGIGKNDTAISIKIMENMNLTADFIETLKNGQMIRILGYTQADKVTNKVSINVVSLKILPPLEMRNDDEEQRRVELHLHTKMSVMDGLSTIEQYCELAKHMGHKAIAITDHGVTQGFPDAQKAANTNNIKMLYGCEFYMVNDRLPFALNPKDIKLNDASYVVFDLETTGLSTRYDRITEFGAIKFEHGSIVKTIDLLINPEMPIPLKIQEKTKITNQMVKNAPKFDEAIDKILEFIGDSILVSHNITFDFGHLNESLTRMGREKLTNSCIDTLSLSRYMFPEATLHNLGALSHNLGIASYNEEEAHRADFDARILNEVWLAMLSRLTEKNENLLHSDLAKLQPSNAMYKHMRPAHVTAIAKNEAGVKSLFELVSLSHINYLADVPKIPKSELTRLRENLLIGSSCQNNDVFDMARTRSRNDLLEAIKWYDYIEVQPPENYINLVHREAVNDLDQIKTFIKDIVECADELHKPVVATGDVHYANPEDKISRDIYIAAKAVGGKPHPLHLRDPKLPNPDQHYRTTKEMLDAFEFLGKEKAFEIVVTNTNAIADLTESINPIHKELIKPEIPNSDKILVESCFKKAHEMFGDNIPQDIVDRLNRELEGINGHGYSVTYYIAHEIIKKAAEDGYMVGSRGSVGSSLAAHLYGITEVNPLSPHYRCPKCRHFEYSDDPNCYSGSDLPEKKCPVCGSQMIHDGQEIPFETFLGFNAEKVPDIDLNFPSDYQARAHDYTKVVFGKDNVYRAGTIGTVAMKTAFGHVRNYFETRGIDPSSIPSERIAYMASHCTDVKRTTGQHPGGIVVLPKGRSIYEFTPIQYPADDKESDWLTTHLDYHAALDAQLLKLDLLGHVDPLALRLMSLLTGVDVKKIPLNDKKVISLFTSTKALNLSENYLKTKIGSSGLPEYGTETCRDILLKAKPKTFAEVVAVAGLAHGTNVWQHNQEQLIRDGVMNLHNCVAARDDIMKYLIEHGVPNDVSFSVMEKVRKGGKVPDKALPVLIEKKIPQYYIDVLNKIKYLYPKAHAVAYATMAVRVGYFKVYYPLEFYAVWFTSRCDAYEIKTMLAGYEETKKRYDELTHSINNRNIKTVKKDEDLHAMFEVCIEMFERGFKFANIDLYKSDATQFIVDKDSGALIPPFIVIDGLGDAAAISLVEARKDGAFSSKEDLLKRTKLNGTNVEDLDAINVLKGLGETDQMSLFEFGLDL